MASDSTSRTLIVLAGLAVLAGCIWLVRHVLPPFLIAIALALLLDPLPERLQRRGVPRGLAVLLTFVPFLLFFLAVMAFLVPRLIGQTADLLQNVDVYGLRLQQAVDTWAQGHTSLLRRLNLPSSLTALWDQYRDSISGYLQVLLSRLFGALQSSAGMLGWLIIVPIVTLWLLMDMHALRARVQFLIPEAQRPVVGELTGKVGRVFTAYLRGLTTVCAAYGLLIYLALAIGFGLAYALMLGLLAAVLFAVPYLGQTTLILVCCAVAGATGHSAGYVLGVAVTLVVIGQLFDQLIVPRMIGKQVGLHPVIGLFALMVGGELFGFAGMIFAVPVAASVRVVLIQLFPRLTAPIPGFEKRQRAMEKAAPPDAPAASSAAPGE
jgi:predicted PurR-regulated permease PerM